MRILFFIFFYFFIRSIKSTDLQRAKESSVHIGHNWRSENNFHCDDDYLETKTSLTQYQVRDSQLQCLDHISIWTQNLPI